jgi:choice-of-anchor B domain-containing protein
LPFTRRTLLVVLTVTAMAITLAGPAAASTMLNDPAFLRANDLEPADGKALLGLSDAEVSTSFTRPVGLECTDGFAGPFPCENVHLESLVPVAEMGGGTGNDVWGWTDPMTGNEYAIMGLSNGTAFIDVTDPRNPVVVGQMPTQSALVLPLWRDIKVYDDHAFAVSEHSAHGMQVFDLTRLRASNSAPSVFTPDAVYSEFSNAHNIVINEDTGFAYAVGTNTCAGGLHMIDINDPVNPSFAGCFDEDGYTHDAQCVVYHGPDRRFRGNEICFNSNEDTVTVVDVTDKENPVMLSRNEYPQAAYTHQGWLTPDHRWFLFGDELDEQRGTVDQTTTYIMDATSLTEQAPITPFFHETNTIDHNLYIHDDFVWQANYNMGLRVLDYTNASLEQGELMEVGYFDVMPGVDIEEFAGAWSVYPFFESGTVVLSTLEEGLFVLRPDLPDSAKAGEATRPGQGQARGPQKAR